MIGVATSKLAVIIATTGRGDLVHRTVGHLSLQTRKADRILVVAVSPADVAGVDPEVVAFAEKGLCRQRNRGLDLIAGGYDIVVYFDDDFVPREDYLEQLVALFDSDPSIAGATGTVLADGVTGAGISFDEALQIVSAPRTASADQTKVSALYGCNMALRMSALGDLRFDERLPFYGWLEDIDLSYQVGQRGRLVRSNAMAGVHMGAKSGRSPGKRLGYSQIANPIYLLRKKTIPPRLAFRLMAKQSLKNAARAFFPEPHVDRRGRLWGNLIALKDFVTGRIDPSRIREFS